MIRRFTFALLASTAAVVAVPQIAQAGCAGTGCGSVSGTANYSASDKKVKATITNKDATSPIHVKFCVNIDYHCNGFDLTLAPHETAARDVPFTGAKPPSVAAVDVVTADFPASRSSSGSAPAGGASAGSGAAVAVSTPKGTVMVLASKQAAVSANLNKAIEYYDKMQSSYATAQEHSSTMHQLVEALGPLDNVEAEVRQVANKDGQVKTDAHVAREAEQELGNLVSIAKQAQISAKYAASMLEVSEGDLKEANDLERAKKLKEEVAREQAVYKGILGVLGQAADIALIATPTTDPATKIGKLSAAVGSLGRLADLIGEVDPRLKEAETLEAEAAKIHMDGLVKKLNATKQYLRDLKGQLAEVQAKLPGYRDTVNNTRNTVEANYDKAVKTQKTGGRFNFDSLQKALNAAQNSVDATRKTYEMAYGVRENIRQINAHAGDDSAWMAFPGEGRKVIGEMYNEAAPVFDWAVKERPIAEALLKRLTAMYQLAKDSMQ